MKGAVLDNFFHFLQAVGVMALLEVVHGTMIQREIFPYVPYVSFDGLKTLSGIEPMNALPPVLCSDADGTDLETTERYHGGARSPKPACI